MLTQHKTFSRFLFAKIARVTPGTDGKRTIWFSKPGSGYEADHKVSLDKLQRDNCYDKLEVGKCYVIDLESYKHGRGTHYVWVDFVEFRDDIMWAKCFHAYMSEYNKENNDEKALKAGINGCGFKAWKLERIKRDSEDLFMY